MLRTACLLPLPLLLLPDPYSYSQSVYGPERLSSCDYVLAHLRLGLHLHLQLRPVQLSQRPQRRLPAGKNRRRRADLHTTLYFETYALFLMQVFLTRCGGCITCVRQFASDTAAHLRRLTAPWVLRLVYDARCRLGTARAPTCSAGASWGGTRAAQAS